MILVDQQKVIVVLISLVCCSLGIALAPATVGEIAASTGQLSNRLKVSKGGRRRMKTIPYKAMILRRGSVLNTLPLNI